MPLGAGEIVNQAKVFGEIQRMRPNIAWQANNFNFTPPDRTWMHRYSPATQFQVDLQLNGGGNPRQGIPNQYDVFIAGDIGHNQWDVGNMWNAGVITD